MYRLLITTISEGSLSLSTNILELPERYDADKIAELIEANPCLSLRYLYEDPSGTKTLQDRHFLRHVQRLYT